MIVTVTLNPSLDRTLSVPELNPGAVLRARLVRTELGGKGINVSRALQGLGLPSRIVAFAGGRTGRALTEGLRRRAFRVSMVLVEGEIRQNITLKDEAHAQYTKINEQGPTVSPRQIARLEALVRRSVQPGDLWAFCGSLPQGAPQGLYARLIPLVQERGARAFLDTSGSPLREGLLAAPFALKVNTLEAGELLGSQLEAETGIRKAARALQARGIRLVVLTRGERGLVLCQEAAMVVAEPPLVAAVSPVAAGDATMAGLLWAVIEGCDAVAAARRAVACGTAAAMQEGSEVGNQMLIRELMEKVKVTLL
jgi:1-phosphofructokinase